MIVDPGQSLTVAAFAATGGMGRAATGLCGGYPGVNDVIVFAHDTNMREILRDGKPYPRDFIEVREWLKEGYLRAGSMEVYQSPAPNIRCEDGDIFAGASAAMGGWGDPLERDYGLVEMDMHYGWVTPDVAMTVYGVLPDEEGKVRVAGSDELRQQIRGRRQKTSIDVKDWWIQEREHVIRRDFSEDVQNMYVDCLKYGKFRRQFTGMWQLPEDYLL